MKTRLEQARSRFLGQTDDKEKKHESYEAQTAARPTAGGSARERFLQNGFGKTMTAERERWGQALDTYRKAAPTISPEDSIARAKRKASTAAPGHVEQDALSTPRRAAEAVSELAPVRTGIAWTNAVQQRQEQRGQQQALKRQQELAGMDLEMGGRALESLRRQHKALQQAPQQYRLPYESEEQFQSRMETNGQARQLRQQADSLEDQLRQAREVQDWQALQEQYGDVDVFAQQAQLEELRGQEAYLKDRRDGGYETAEQWELSNAAYRAVKDRADQLEREVSKAKQVQGPARFERYRQDPEFAQYAQQGRELENPKWRTGEGGGGPSIFGWQPFARETANPVTFYLDNVKVGGAEGYEYMTQDELDLYNYLLAKHGKKLAQDYLDDLADTLNARKGHKLGQEVRDIDSGLLRTASTAAYGAVSGLDQFFGGVKSLGSDEYQPVSAIQYGSQYVRDDLKDTGPDIFGSSLGQAAYDLVTTTGNMVPSILLSAVTSGLGAPAAIAQGVGAATLGLSASGNAYQQALAEGYSPKQARSYSVLVGASEAGLQYVLGGIGALGKNGLSQVAKASIQNIDSALGRIAAEIGLDMLGEGSEEYLQEILDPVFHNLLLDEDNEIRLVSRDAAYSFLLGALSAGLLEGGHIAASNLDLNKTGAAVQDSGHYEPLLDKALKLDPSTEAYQAAQKLRSGQTPASAINVGQLLTYYAEAGGNLDFMAQAPDPVSRQTEKAASTEETDSTVINTDPAQHTPSQQAVIEAYKNSADTELQEFILKVRGLQNNDYRNKIRTEISTETTNALQEAQRLTGVNTEGFTHILKGNAVQHIDKRHGANGTADHSMANLDDFSRIGFVLDNFTQARTVPVSKMDTGMKKLAMEWKNSDGTYSPLIQYSMPVNGTYYVVEAIPDSKAKNLAVVSAYMTSGKENGSTLNHVLSLPENQTASVTSETLHELLDTSNTSVTQGKDAVKVQANGRGHGQDAVSTQNYGDYGAKVFSELVETSGLTQEQVERQFHTAYELGRLDTPVDKVPLETELQRIAYNAGRIDAIKSTATKDAAQAQRTKTYGETAGLVRDDAWKKANLSTKANRTLDALAQTLGVQIRFTDTVQTADGRKANAKYQDGVITLALDAKDPLTTTVLHEAVHRIREVSPEAYESLQRIVQRNTTDETMQGHLRLRQEQYQTQNVDYLTEEIVADAFGRMLGDKDFMAQFAKEHRTLAQRFADAVQDIINAVKRLLNGQNKKLTKLQKEAFGELQQHLIAMQRVFTNALETAHEQVQGLQGQTKTAQEGGEARYSINEAFRDDIRQWYDEGQPAGEQFILGSTGPVLQGLGAIESDIYMSGDKISAIFAKHPEMSLYEIQRIPEILEDPVLILKSRNFGRKTKGNTRLVLFGSVKAKDGRPVMCIMDLRPTEKGFLLDDMQKVTSAYTKDNHPKAFIMTSDALFVDKKRTTRLLSDIGFQAPISCNRSGYMGNIAYEGGNVKIQGVPVSSVLSQDVADGRLSMSDRELLEAYVKKYGAISKGETPFRDVTMPKQTADGKKLSQTVRTVLEARATPDEAIADIETLAARGDFSYDVYTDKQAISDAERAIRQEGWSSALSNWAQEVSKGVVSKENAAMGWALYNNAANQGDMETALTVLTQMVEHQRSAAQALQATRILKKLSPEAQLYGVQRSVASLQKELNTRYGSKKSPALKIDQDLAEQFMAARDQESRDAALRDIYRDIGRQMPSNVLDKWNAWRYLAMLGNPRTHVRNVVGNAGFMPVVAVKNLTATAIEAAVSRLSGGKLDRTKATVGFGSQDRAILKAAWNDYQTVQEAALGGGKYSDFANANRYVEEGRVIFQPGKLTKNIPGAKTAMKGLEAARKLNSKALDAEDVWFSKPHYAAAMAQYCKANHISAEQISQGIGLEKARQYAILEAQKATYRDTNALSQTIGGFGRADNSTAVAKGLSRLLEGILPFRKTPANILARGLEYSPLGLINGIKQAIWDVRKGTKTGAQAIDSISAGLTGTGLVALGIYLAAQGLLRGHGGGDEKKNKFEQLLGRQAYSLELPGGISITLDWLAPECLPLFIGVNLWELTQGEREELTLSAVLSAVSTISEPLLQMSCLQSLNDVFDAVGYASSEGLSGLPAALASAATSYLTQGLPTVFGQIERSGEGLRYTTYTEKNVFLTGDLQYTLGRASARIPGWDYQQIPYIDAWGRVEQTGSAAARTFQNFLNPAYVSRVEMSPMEQELLRLYEATGESGVLPSRAAKFFTVDGQRKDLTAEEYVTYAKRKGQTAYTLLQDLTSGKDYEAMTDEQRVKAVEDVFELANQQAKAAISDYETAGWMENARKAEADYGIAVEQYIALRIQTAGIVSLKDKDGKTITNSKSLLIMQEIYNTPGLTQKQRKALFEFLGVGKSVQHYNKAAVQEALEKMKRQ